MSKLISIQLPDAFEEDLHKKLQISIVVAIFYLAVIRHFVDISSETVDAGSTFQLYIMVTSYLLCYFMYWIAKSELRKIPELAYIVDRGVLINFLIIGSVMLILQYSQQIASVLSNSVVGISLILLLWGSMLIPLVCFSLMLVLKFYPAQE